MAPSCSEVVRGLPGTVRQRGAPGGLSPLIALWCDPCNINQLCLMPAGEPVRTSGDPRGRVKMSNFHVAMRDPDRFRLLV